MERLGDNLDNRDCLLVDDDQDFLTLSKTMLEAKGLSVEIAPTVAEALEALQNFEFRLISLDITLERENAAEVLVYLKKEEANNPNSNKPIFICSSHVTDGFKMRMENRGFSCFSKKTDMDFFYDEVVIKTSVDFMDQMDQAFEDNVDIEEIMDGAVKDMLDAPNND